MSVLYAWSKIPLQLLFDLTKKKKDSCHYAVVQLVTVQISSCLKYAHVLEAPEFHNSVSPYSVVVVRADEKGCSVMFLETAKKT